MEEGGANANLSGSLYTQLDECVANMTRWQGCYDVVSHVDSMFLQMFMWEHFENLVHTSIEYSAIVFGRPGASPNEQRAFIELVHYDGQVRIGRFISFWLWS